MLRAVLPREVRIRTVAGDEDGRGADPRDSLRATRLHSALGAGPVQPRRTWKMLRAGSGDGVAVSSVTTEAPAMKLSSSRPCTSFEGAGSEARRRGRPSTGSAECEASITTLPNRLAFSICVSVMIATCAKTDESVAACARAKASAPPSATFTATTPPGASSGAIARVELGARHVRRRARTGEDVDHDDVDAAEEPGRQLAEHLAGVAVPDADLRAAGQRQRLPHEVDQRALDLDDLLPRARPGRRDVAGEGERPAAEVQRGDGLALGGEQVDRVADAAHVLEREVGRVGEVDVRLRRAVDDEGHGVGRVPVGLDLREVAAVEDGAGVLGVVAASAPGAFLHPTSVPGSRGTRVGGG